MTSEVRVKKGEKPPETIEEYGKTYRPKWLDVTSAEDLERNEQVYMISELGDPVEDNGE